MDATLQKPKKKITLDDLAAVLKRQFDHIDTQFENIDERFKKIDERFEKIDERFDRIDARFDSLERRFDKIDDIAINDHRPRIQALEKETGLW